MPTAIWWVRRDLRLTDNLALSAAVAQADNIAPVFVFDPRLLNSDYVGNKRLAFLLAGLRRLDESLQQRGSRLIIRRGEPQQELHKLLHETSAQTIYAEADVSPFARRRDEQLAQHLPLKQVGGLTVFPPDAVLKDDGDPYTVYTPYSRTWKSLPQPSRRDLLPAPARINTPTGLASEPLPAEPSLPNSVPFPAGEAEAQRRLQAFADETASPIQQYKKERDRMDLDGTSRLSPYLRFGMLSARQAAVAAREAIEQAPNANAPGPTTWLNELIWREFYIAILYHFPHVRSGNFRQKFDAFPWRNDQEQFLAWRQGQTGYPVVDAAMRQLVQSGWMHNRARMIVASFLVKHLLIDWRWGEKFFMQHLVDGDPAANNGGWQWTAGCGTDAAPYFRIFNPFLQSQKFDPDGAYIRRWLPGLANVPPKYIHTPWEMPLKAQRQAGCVIGQDYPAPIVDHKTARRQALAAFDEVKKGD